MGRLMVLAVVAVMGSVTMLAVMAVMGCSSTCVLLVYMRSPCDSGGW